MIADLDKSLPDPCKNRNTVHQMVKTEEYKAGETQEYFRFLCGEAKMLDVDLIEKDQPLKPEFWRTTANPE